MAINSVGAGPVSIPSVASRPASAPSTAAAPRPLNLFPDGFDDGTATSAQAATATADGSGESDAAKEKKEVDEQIFQMMFDNFEKNRKARADENDPWK